DLGFANVDHHRSLRQGFPEVIFGMGKTVDQVAKIVQAMQKHNHNILVTRTTETHYARVKAIAPEAEYNEAARAIVIQKGNEILVKVRFLFVSAGPVEIGVGEKAVVPLRVMGNEVEPIYDVGVAGLHRLLDRRERLMKARVVIVVAG